MPNFVDPRSLTRSEIGLTADGMTREGGNTQSACGWDPVSFSRAPSYRQQEIGDPKAAATDNTKVMMIAAAALAAVYLYSRK